MSPKWRAKRNHFLLYPSTHFFIISCPLTTGQNENIIQSETRCFIFNTNRTVKSSNSNCWEVLPGCVRGIGEILRSKFQPLPANNTNLFKLGAREDSERINKIDESQIRTKSLRVPSTFISSSEIHFKLSESPIKMNDLWKIFEKMNSIS